MKLAGWLDSGAGTSATTWPGFTLQHLANFVHSFFVGSRHPEPYVVGLSLVHGSILFPACMT